MPRYFDDKWNLLKPNHCPKCEGYGKIIPRKYDGTLDMSKQPEECNLCHGEMVVYE